MNTQAHNNDQGSDSDTKIEEVIIKTEFMTGIDKFK